LAAACWASGAVLLAGPPVNAGVAFWPPVGVALAGLLVGGSRLWPGAFLGFWGLAAFAPAAVALPAPLPGLYTAVVYTVQALLGAWLIRRLCGSASRLVRFAKIVRFLLVAGPGHCLLAATVRVLVETFPDPRAAWLQVWAADTIGGLIAAPVVLALVARPRDVWRPRVRTVAVPLAVLAAGSVLAHGYAHRTDTAVPHRRVQRTAETLGLRLEAEGNRLAAMLETYRDWMRRGVPTEDARQAIVRNRSREFHAMFPVAGDLQLIAEAAAPPAYREAMRQTARTGEPAATGLLPGDPDRFAILVRAAAAPDRPGTDYLACLIDARQMVRDTLAIREPLFTGVLAESAAGVPADAISKAHPVRFADRDWAAVVYADPAYPRSLPQAYACTATVVSLVAAALLASLVLALTGRTAVVEAEVRRRAEQLALAQADRAKVEAALQQARREAALGRLAGGVAHEFNNLFTGVLGHASRGRDALPPDHPAQAELARIEQAILDAGEICQQILASTGRGTTIRQPIELNGFVPAVVADVRPRLPNAPDVRVAVLPAPVTLTADALQLRRLLTNLLTNAAEAYTEPGRPVVLKYGLLDGVAWLEVTDEGCGIPPDVLDRVYEPFFTTRFVGRGLGLSAVRGIVQSHGGTVTITSRPAAGTTVRVTLDNRVPADTVLTPPPSRHPTVPLTHPAYTPAGRAGLAVVVDDDATVREFAALSLRGVGWEVLPAENGEEAVGLVGRHADRVRLVVLDLLMPVMDGHTALGLLRQRHPALPVILMSGFSDFDLSGEFRGGTPLAFLRKPFRQAELLDCVGEVLALAKR
jgi:signal transduction histidine kinase/CheY-like chemotaxis protein